MSTFLPHKDIVLIVIIILIFISVCSIFTSKSCKGYNDDFKSNRNLNYQQELDELEKICSLHKDDLKGQLECLDRRNKIKETFIKNTPTF